MTLFATDNIEELLECHDPFIYSRPLWLHCGCGDCCGARPWWDWRSGGVGWCVALTVEFESRLRGMTEPRLMQNFVDDVRRQEDYADADRQHSIWIAEHPWLALAYRIVGMAITLGCVAGVGWLAVRSVTR